MEEYLNIIAPHLPPALVSPSALARIQALSQLLPPFSLAGFESRLGAEQPIVDLLVRFPGLVPNFSPQLLAHPVWQALHRFCQEWVESDSPLQEQVQHIWLEFDLDRSPLPVPIPCLFLSLDATVTLEADEVVHLAHQIPAHPLPAAIASRLHRCVDALPVGARVGHLGAMLSRPGQAVRVVVMGMHVEDIADYLLRIGWTDSSDRLQPLIHALSQQIDSIGILDLDVGETVFPKIGLECFAKPSADGAQWHSFVNYLVAQGLCTPAKRDALLNWSGYSQSTPQNCPSNLSWGDRFLGTSGYSIFWRSLSHIKISYHPLQPLEAKGYLAFGHNWFEADSLHQPAISALAQ